jgi:hypothetical protein
MTTTSAYYAAMLRVLKRGLEPSEEIPSLYCRSDSLSGPRVTTSNVSLPAFKIEHVFGFNPHSLTISEVSCIRRDTQIEEAAPFTFTAKLHLFYADGTQFSTTGIDCTFVSADVTEDPHLGSSMRNVAHLYWNTGQAVTVKIAYPYATSIAKVIDLLLESTTGILPGPAAKRGNTIAFDMRSQVDDMSYDKPRATFFYVVPTNCDMNLLANIGLVRTNTYTWLINLKLNNVLSRPWFLHTDIPGFNLNGMPSSCLALLEESDDSSSIRRRQEARVSFRGIQVTYLSRGVNLHDLYMDVPYNITLPINNATRGVTLWAGPRDAIPLPSSETQVLDVSLLVCNVFESRK